MQSSYFDPYKIKKKINDVNLVVETPEHRRIECLVHVNLLKPYHIRESEAWLIQDQVPDNKVVPEDYCLDQPVKLCNRDILAKIEF
ncbi:hypothetical protein Hamer_G013094 [Homarus americanus]|uniref:Uncharacterized protein n=1 Tax=Homarus americanus TaxID=6706 RepID=A0A8J5JZT1_HOMAM|nr:hypothetical protein Hamer_G013094 [Homarus americanus]